MSTRPGTRAGSTTHDRPTVSCALEVLTVNGGSLSDSRGITAAHAAPEGGRAEPQGCQTRCYLSSTTGMIVTIEKSDEFPSSTPEITDSLIPTHVVAVG